MKKTYIKNATIINEGNSFKGSVLIEDEKIAKIYKDDKDIQADEVIDATGLLLIPGVIDDQVHFREPGLTHKADIYTESRAAAAGGVSSFMEMPNTNPQTITISELNKKFEIAENSSLVNYSFYLGATNDNLDEIKKIDPTTTCGVKVFMGSSTGNMLVDQKTSLEGIFAESPVLIATHCEDEETIRENTVYFLEKFGQDVPFSAHPLIRSAEACYKSSSLAVGLAEKYNSRLHILHISTEKELSLFRNDIQSQEKKITAEVCVHHLLFNDSDYEEKKSWIKWNPAIKTEKDRKALFEGLLNGKLDVIATDHAPHTAEEKSNLYFKAPSGGPMVQHSLVSMFEFYKKGLISREMIIDKMCHKPAELFQVDRRGFIREGYYADLVLLDPEKEWTVDPSNILYKCGWSPLLNTRFSTSVEKTFVNGQLVYDNGKTSKNNYGIALRFNR